MNTRVVLLSIGLSFYLAIYGFAAVIDHQSIADLNSASQGLMDLAGMQKWFFNHASVGGNMVEGMNSLHSANPTRYRLATSYVAYGSGQANPAPGSTTYGTIYECNRGNPGWSSKITIFANSVNNAGWHDTAIDLAMDKMCYIDQDADSAAYLASMAALEAAHPATKFVYITMPLTTDSDSSNVLRNQYNQAVRAYCAANGKLLFDIADMEAYDPSGVRQTFSYGGQIYEKLYSGYSSDGGHLNSTGEERIGKGWYATAVYATRYVPFSESWSGGTAGHTNDWAATGNWSLSGGSAIIPDAPGIKLIFGKSGSIATADLGAVGRIVGGIQMQNAVPTTISGAAVLTLDNNGATSQISVSGHHEIDAGLYFKDNLEIGGGGILDFDGALSGAASKTLTIDAGTSVNLNNDAQNIANPITVNGSLTTGRLIVPVLTLGAGATVVIRAIPSGPLSDGVNLQSVPEPSVFAMLVLATMIGALANFWTKVSGARGMERGTVSMDRDENGNDVFADMELCRLAVPRRVYNTAQMDYVVDMN
jgi:hypothetical protein